MIPITATKIQKRAIAALTAIAAAAALYLLVEPRAARTAANGIVVNGDFEQGGNGVPSGWNLEEDLQDRGTVQVVQGPTGRALELRPNSKNRRSDRPFGIGQLASGQSVQGKRVVLSADLKATRGATAVVLVLVLSGGQIAAQANIASDSQEFGRRTAEFEVDGRADRLIIGCVVNGTSGSAFFDNVSIDAGSASSAPPSGASPGRDADLVKRRGGELRGSVQVDAGRMIKAVDRKLFGTNLAWVWNADSVWDESTRRIRPDIIQRAKDLGVSVVRFPAGTFADYYHWRDGIGPHESRPVRPHGTDDNQSKNVIGTDDLVEFCRAIGAEPQLGINITTGTPQEAADWVAYCNRPNHPERAKNGHAEPYNVRLWEIGNEQYIKDGGPSTRNAYLTPADYAARYNAFAAAMRKVDPTIRLIGIGGTNFGRYHQMEDNNWNSVVLQQASESMDYLAVHNAYAPAGASSAHVSVEEVYTSMLASPKLIADNFRELNRQIETYAPGRASQLKLAVTEWGPLFHFLPSDSYVAHPKTMGSGLFVASVMQAFLNADRVELANFFKLSEHAFMGWVDARGVPKPSYYALQMYSRHFGTRLVATRVNSPTFSSKAVGMVDAVRDAPFLEAVSSTDPQSTRLYVIVVNKNLTDPIQADISINGFQPKQSGMVRVLTAPSVDANNGDDLPKIPGLKWGTQARASRNSMFLNGTPETVVPRTSEFNGAGTQFAYSFLPLSVTAFEFVAR